MQHETAEVREADRAEHEDREGVLRQLVTAIERCRQKAIVAEWREHTGDEQLDGSGGKDYEAPEDRRVHRAGHRLSQNLRLRDAHAEHIPYAAPGSIDALLG